METVGSLSVRSESLLEVFAIVEARSFIEDDIGLFWGVPRSHSSSHSACGSFGFKVGAPRVQGVYGSGFTGGTV